MLATELKAECQLLLFINETSSKFSMRECVRVCVCVCVCVCVYPQNALCACACVYVVSPQVLEGIREQHGRGGDSDTLENPQCAHCLEVSDSIPAVCFASPFVVVQLLSHVRLFATPWTAEHLASCPPLSPRVCSN